MPTTEADQEAQRIDIRLLGELVAYRDGAPLSLGGRQQRSVLALLVLARGDVVPGDRLLDDLWPGRPPASATSTLHSYVSRLRSAIDPVDATERNGQKAGVIVRQGPGYRLQLPADAVDAWRFERALDEVTRGSADERVERLSTALSLWRGPALADFVGQTWADTEATRLDGLREVARDQLLAARLDRGETAVLVPELERLVAEDPLQEERWRLLALALYRSSRQADALAALRRARQHLADELGVDPGPALRQLESDVLAQSSGLDAVRAPAAGPAVVEPASGGPPPAAPARTADPLVDREAELADLAAALDDALDGRGGLVVLEGQAGIGKTRLLAEARRLAIERGFRPASARGSQLERAYGFGAVRQMLEPLLAANPDRVLFDGPAAPAAAVFDADTGDPNASPADNFALLNGLYWVLARAASTGPVLLAVDDLQWCDAGSLRFLAFAKGRLERLPVLVVSTLRTGEAHADDDLLADIVADPATVVIRPRPLSDAATGTLIRGRLGDAAAPSFLAACYGTTGGNPLLLRQLLRALESERVPPDAAHAHTVTAIGSRAVSSMVLLRLRRLPPSAAAVARAVAVLGDGAALPAVATLAELSEPEAVEAVATLAKAEVLSASHPLGFVHPLVAEAVYRDLAPGQREAAHERAARIVEASGGTDEQIAAHLLVSPTRGDPWVADVLSRAAARARHRGAPDAAAAYLARAVDEPPPREQLVDLLMALAMSGGIDSGEVAHRALERAYDLASDAQQRAEVSIMLVNVLIFLGPRGVANRFALRAVEALPDELVDAHQALVALGRTAGWIHDLPVSRWLSTEPVEIRGEGVGSRILAIEQAWELCVRGVDRERAIELVRVAMGDVEYVEGDHDFFHDVAHIALMVAGLETEPFWTDALRRLHARGESLAVGVYLWQGVAMWRRGDLRAAYQAVLIARHQTEDWGSSGVGVPYCNAFLVLVMLDLGDVSGARTHLDQALQQQGIGDGRRLLHEAQAAVLLAEGRAEDALATIDRALRDQDGLDNPAWYGARALRAEILLALGRRAEAVRILQAEVAGARRWGADDSTGRLLSRLAYALGENDVDRDAAEAAAREAVRLLAPGFARQERGRASMVLAALTADSDERIALLRRALQDADDCQASGLRRDVESALRRLGADVPAASGPSETLTVLDRECTELAGAGLDATEIAGRLLIPRRTVDAILASVRHRLGATADAELTAVRVG